MAVMAKQRAHGVQKRCVASVAGMWDEVDEAVKGESTDRTHPGANLRVSYATRWNRHRDSPVDARFLLLRRRVSTRAR